MLVLWEDIKKSGYHSLVKFYLMSCYLYYEKDVNVLLDNEFDEMCKILLNNFDKIKHMHKHLLDKESLKASTGYTIKYPLIIQHLANKWYDEYIAYKVKKENETKSI